MLYLSIVLDSQNIVTLLVIRKSSANVRLTAADDKTAHVWP